MEKQDKEQLWIEIEHIFDSGANKIRVFNMVEAFIEKRYQALRQPPVISSVCPFCNGSGKLGTLDEHRNCDKCKGTGQTNGSRLCLVRDLENEIINLKINYNGTRKFK